MIPKTIHYCWFGRNEKPDVVKKCIKTWEMYLPDWQIIEWNEDNYDISSSEFVSEAYAAKKWAFVSDYARLDVLYRYGGVYLDTDVELKSFGALDKYTEYENLLAFETERAINSGLVYAAQKNSTLCYDFLECYRTIHYHKDNEVTNTDMNKRVIENRFPELKWNGKTQVFNQDCIIGLDEYGAMMHHYGVRSWCDDLPAYKVRSANWVIKKLRSPSIFEKMEKTRGIQKLVPIYTFCVYDLYDLGPMFYIKRQIMKRDSRRKRKDTV